MCFLIISISARLYFSDTGSSHQLPSSDEKGAHFAGLDNVRTETDQQQTRRQQKWTTPAITLCKYSPGIPRITAFMWTPDDGNDPFALAALSLLISWCIKRTRRVAAQEEENSRLPPGLTMPRGKKKKKKRCYRSQRLYWHFSQQSIWLQKVGLMQLFPAKVMFRSGQRESKCWFLTRKARPN